MVLRHMSSRVEMLVQRAGIVVPNVNEIHSTCIKPEKSGRVWIGLGRLNPFPQSKVRVKSCW